MKASARVPFLTFLQVAIWGAEVIKWSSEIKLEAAKKRATLGDIT